MAIDIELADLRDQVLRKIGRNVVNFQKMEGMLKFLNSLQALSGSLKDIEKIAARAKKATSKQPMGRLADAFVQSVYSATSQAAEQSDNKEVSVSFSFKIDSDPSLVRERRRALRSVVVERNNLIHKWLASFDPNSIESCMALRSALDEQHAKIWPEFQELKGVMATLKECQAELQRYVASDAFLTDFKESSGSA